jgi:predicted DNA-binding WGR domain protein
MTHVRIQDAYTTDATGNDWYVRLEYIGGNSKNVGGYSTKFYEAGKDGSGYFIRYGKIGTKGARKGHPSASAVLTQVSKKEAKGYSETPPHSAIPAAGPTPTPTPEPTAEPAVLNDPTFGKAPEGRYDVLLMAGGEQNKKISAIKAVRTATGWGLKEAKAAVEGGAGTKLGVGLTKAQTQALRDTLHASGYKSGWTESGEFNVDLSEAGAVFGLVTTVRRVNGSWRGFDASGRSLMAIPDTLLH